MAAKATPRICAYCGCSDPQTMDHVPPKGVFPDPLPSDLITVPCCSDCHHNTSKDDEHFRNVLLSASNLEQEPRASSARHRVLRSLSRKEQNAYWQRFVASIQEVDVVTGGGIWVGRQPGLPISARIPRVVERIARGLFFHQFGMPVPATHEVVKASLDQFGFQATRLAETFGITVPRTTAWGGQFAYGFKMVDCDPASGIWIGEFYGHALVMAFFVKKGRPKPPSPTPI